MKLLVVLIICAGAFSLPVDDPINATEDLLKKVLEANPSENDIGVDEAVGKDVTQSITSVEPNIESNDDLEIANDFTTSTETIDTENTPFEIITQIGNKTRKEADISLGVGNIFIDPSNDNVDYHKPLTEVAEEMIPEIEDPFNLFSDDTIINGNISNDQNLEIMVNDSAAKMTNEQLFPDYDMNKNSNTRNEADPFEDFTLDNHKEMSSISYPDETDLNNEHNLFESLNKDHPVMVNPFLTPSDTLPLEPELLDGSTRHELPENMPQDYPEYDDIMRTEDKSPFESHSDTQMQDENIPSNSEALNPTNSETPNDNQEISFDHTGTFDESLAHAPQEYIPDMSQMEDSSFYGPSMNTDMHSENMPHESEMFDGKSVNIPYGGNKNFEDIPYDSIMNMKSNPHSHYYNSYGNIDSYDIYDQYINAGETNSFNPYVYYPNNFDGMSYQPSIQDENESGTNQYQALNNKFPKDLLADTDISRNDKENTADYIQQPMSQLTKDIKYFKLNEDRTPIPSVIENMRFNTPNLVSQNNNMLLKNYNTQQEKNSVQLDGNSDYIPMPGGFPLKRQSPVKVPLSLNKDYSYKFQNTPNDLSMILFNGFLRNPNYQIRESYFDPYGNNVAPIIIIMESSKRDKKNEMTEDAKQKDFTNENEIESEFINKDGTLLTGINYDTSIPYSPSYHPAYYPQLNQYDTNHYPFNHKTDNYNRDYYNDFPVNSNTDYYNNMIEYANNPNTYYPNEHHNIDYTDAYHTSNNFKNRVGQFPDYLINPYASQRKHHRQYPTNFMNDYYY